MRRKRSRGRNRLSRRVGHPELLEERRVLAAVPVISELMAVNDGYLADEDGSFSDWLELANLGDQSISLNGWYLTDDATNLTKWPLPDMDLSPGDQRLVFASGKDRRDVQEPLHTNFRLDGDGEYLALIQADGTTVAFAYQPGYPPQVPDVAYGVFGSNLDAGYFSLPSPGTANAQPPSDLPPQAIMISEIMYHPASENDAEEYVELFNAGSAAVDLAGWRISGGIDVTLPNVTLPPGEVMVVAADVGLFQATYPPVSLLVGPWTGRLSNSSDTITLRDTLDRVVDRVRYADEGDWAVRASGPDDLGHTGWVWLDDHDGGGRSLEMVNARLPNEFGQNWAASLVDRGTPGTVNSVAIVDSAPLIVDLKQSPIIPRAVDAVQIKVRVIDDSTSSVQVDLNWRVDGVPTFEQMAMLDDGQNGDLVAGDGVYLATIPSQPDRTVIEYFVSAEDVLANRRTWPAATADAGQVTNALYQVIDEFDPQTTWQPGSPPIYFQVMTAIERDEFTNISRKSDAQMNATWISVNGDGVKLRHNVGVRVRGSGSRNAPTPNNRINIPSDRPWQGVTALNFNVTNVRNQIAGSVLMRLAGVATAEATGALMYSNGVDLRNGNMYAQVEPLNGDFAGNHFPGDSNGNLYKGRRPNESPPGGLGAGLVYFGPDPAPYVSYTKLTNESQADWSDVIQLTDTLNNAPDETYLQQLAEVADIDQWLRFFAINVLVSNTEGGLVNGDRRGDDYAMYRGQEDSRFQMVPHDLDSVLSQTRRGILTALNVPALRRLLLHPEIRPRYYQTLLDLVDKVLLADSTETVLRDTLRNVANAGQIDNVLNFLQQRASFVRASVPQGISLQTSLRPTNGRIDTSETGLGLWGTADYRANSVLVNGQPARFTTTNNTWEIGSSIGTVLPWNTTWQYLDDGSDQGTAWREPDFVPDASWQAGEAELGYGDGDEVTVVGFGGDENDRFITTYFRREFNVADASRYASLVLNLVRDDGAVAFLNGQQIARSNLPSGVPIDYLTRASNNVSGGSERSVLTFGIDPALLVDGKNVLAVEIHQASPSSADVSFRARLRGRFTPPNGGVPLVPGVNHVIVQAMSGVDGTGEVLATQRINVWRNVAATVVEGSLPAGDTVWTAAAGPYQVRGQVEVPADGKLIIQPGTSVYFEADAELIVRGTLVAKGNAQARIRFTSVPDAADVPDLPGLPAGPPRWKGIHFVDSKIDENVIAYADIEYAQDPNGSIGVLDSTLLVEQVTFRGTHRRMVYGKNASLIIRDSDFPDMFAPDENPADLRLDNVAEHVKLIGRTPAGGKLIIQGNRFGTNKGHNDVIDADSNRVGRGPILQILDNVFAGSGDELLDLGGDVYVAGNLFMNVSKDDSTSDRGYANVISTGDAGANTTIVVARNVFYDVDHAINLKNNAATIFENNTVVRIHPDFDDRFGDPNVGSAINLFVDEPGARPGAGAYAARNIFSDAPRVFGNADLPDGRVTPLQLDNNLISSELALTSIGSRPGSILDLGLGNIVEDPRLTNPTELDFRVRPGSAALAPTLPVAWGADVSPDAWIDGVPTSPSTLGSATLTVGGPGLFGFRYRVNGGAWSDETPIGTGWDANGTVRTAEIQLDALADGQYTVEVQGKDFAGTWQVTPTVSETWTVDRATNAIVINELLASNQTVLSDAGARPDLIELRNLGNTATNLRGMTLSDDSERPDKFTFTEDVIIPAGGFLTLMADSRDTPGIHLGFSLRREGEGVFLYQSDGERVDSVEFGMQVTDWSVGRVGPTGQWQLTKPTFDAENVPARTGDQATLAINEWLAGAASGSDFVELFNPDPLPVDLSGLWLSDAGDSQPDRHAIAPLSFVAGRGFAVFKADGDNEGRPDHVGFRLSTHQETLQLSNSDLSAIDTVPYSPQAEGVSQGRLPDGANVWSFFELPSPGWPNGAGFPGDLNRDGQIGVQDIDLLCAGIRTGSGDSALDLNRDQQVDFDDMTTMIESLLGTNFGDANLDGIFNSNDLVLIFQAGQYEDAVPGNSTWATGDWNCDGDFGTEDLVQAFQAGAYDATAVPGAVPVPHFAGASITHDRRLTPAGSPEGEPPALAGGVDWLPRVAGTSITHDRRLTPAGSPAGEPPALAGGVDRLPRVAGTSITHDAVFAGWPSDFESDFDVRP